MTAPYKPRLISPKPLASADHASALDFVLGFDAFSPGETLHQYQLRRKRLAPTAGSYEFWNGSTWTTSTWLTATAGIEDQGTQVVTVGASFWSNGESYEWSANFRNSALEESGWAPSSLLRFYTKPSLAFDLPATVESSRPQLRWQFAGDTGRRQRSYRLAVYTAGVTGSAGFDPSDPGWQENSEWITERIFSSSDQRATVEADLAAGVNHSLYYLVEDDLGLSSGWTLGDSFLIDFLQPPAPALSVAALHGQGLYRIEIASSFNLLPAENASFTESFGDWYPALNSRIDLDSPFMRMTVKGGTYEDFQDEFGDFSNQQSSVGTFTDETQTRTTPSNFSEIFSCDVSSTDDMVALLPGTAYSAVAVVTSLDAQLNLQTGILWYNSSGSLLSSSFGSSLACSPGVEKDVPVQNVTSPANTAFGVVVIRIVNGQIGNRVRVRGVALSQTSSISWSPGGDSVELSFVLERKTSETDWTPCWGASHENPLVPVSEVDSRITYLDKEAPLGREDIQYRAYVRSGLADIKYSSPSIANAPVLKESSWWIRCPESDLPCSKFRATELTFEREDSSEVVYADGAKYGYVVTTGQAPKRSLGISGYTLDESEFNSVERLLHSGEILYVQRNIGEGFLVRVLGRVTKQQRRAVGSGGLPRHYHTFSFSAEEVSRNELL